MGVIGAIIGIETKSKCNYLETLTQTLLYTKPYKIEGNKFKTTFFA